MTFSSRKRVLKASINSRRPTIGSPKPASSFNASSACKLPTSPTSGPITPASLQVSSASLP
ncbi:MFS family permease [Pseudomonas syringae pv. actinidiae]|uniref:MFS family permease n=1 Tax=Pseudomonas syringae pv. actinidiae TaxID=103796 RepID=A0AAN4Q1N0_PSESF|nr:MFS family permease [Pseudomonas syringae pv. actinidiae]